MQIYYDRDELLTPFAIKTLQERYMIPGEVSPQDAFARAAKAFADNDEHAQRMYDYASKQWFMFSTPILSNGGTSRGLPISCYLQNVEDSRKGILDHYTEVGWLSSMGGGLGGYWGNLRSDGIKTSKGSVSFGTIPFLKVLDAEVMAFVQGGTRRASYAWYQRIDHPEIEENLIARKPTGGDPNRKLLNLHNAVCITDKFMEAVEQGKDWNLIDPHTKSTVKTTSARALWELIIHTRAETGEPYLFFTDTVNRAVPKSQKDLGLTVDSSNLCAEVTLATSPERTAVCCLSSPNLEYFDEWSKDPLFMEDINRYLDNVLTFFIKSAPEPLWRATFSALRERALGIGAMGFHSYLQRNMIPFEGPIARGVNKKIFAYMKAELEKSTRKLAQERGACPDSSLEDPVRNMWLMAVAPNASTSILANTSPSIEPIVANAFSHKTLSGSFLVRNKYLVGLLESKGLNTEEVWQSITLNDGSVQHLEELTDWEKEVFKTAVELDQRVIIDLAADRQEYICQSQSLNLFFLPDAPIKYVHDVHWRAWKKGVKTLYYYRSSALRNADKISAKVERIIRQETDDECLGCQG